MKIIRTKKRRCRQDLVVSFDVYQSSMYDGLCIVDSLHDQLRLHEATHLIFVNKWGPLLHESMHYTKDFSNVRIYNSDPTGI